MKHQHSLEQGLPAPQEADRLTMDQYSEVAHCSYDESKVRRGLHLFPSFALGLPTTIIITTATK